MGRLPVIAYWLAPPIFCLLIYWPGLLAWFQQDDFAWLGLRRKLSQGKDLWRLLFEPMGPGHIRPLSDRGFFLLFSTLFGFNPLPYRMLAFLTQFANLALLSSITHRLTGSRTASLLAPLLWVANDALGVPLSWSSAYNQVLCSFFVLLSFFFLLRYAKQGRTRDLAAQWVAFLLGFGALEINVVYPALATAYALCCTRRILKSTLLLWIPSVLFS